MAIKIVDFAVSQLDNSDWELSQFFDRESSGSKLLLMSALLSSYCGALDNVGR